MTQPDLKTWLARKPAGRKPKRPLPKHSRKGTKLGRQYSARAKAYKLRWRQCMAVLPGCTGATTDVHHTKGRGSFLLREETWMPVCQHCHNWIHANPSKARMLCLLF